MGLINEAGEPAALGDGEEEERRIQFENHQGRLWRRREESLEDGGGTEKERREEKRELKSSAAAEAKERERETKGG